MSETTTHPIRYYRMVITDASTGEVVSSVGFKDEPVSPYPAQLRETPGGLHIPHGLWERIVAVLKNADSWCSLVVHRRHEFENADVRKELGEVSSKARAILQEIGRWT